jgi:DNA-binding CsgD family transcriptional regulator/Tfp pilus assembly protein PilF
MIAAVTEVERLLADGRAALRIADVETARRSFEAAMVESPCGEALEGLAGAAFLAMEWRQATDLWERAYNAYREAQDHVGAIRTARWIGYLHGMVLGDGAVMSGWIARAQRLLGDAPDTPERGWVALTKAMFEGDRGRKHEWFAEALEVAREQADADLECSTLAYYGASLVHDDRPEEGMVLLDEAMAAVAGREVDDFAVLQDVFCQLFAACEHAHDVARADQWIRVGEAIAQRRNLPSLSAFCRTHYGGLLTAAGRWSEADVALSEAVRLAALGQNRLRLGARARLAELRVRQGRLEEAERLLEDADMGELAAARASAGIHLSRGETALARHALDRGLDGVELGGTAAASLLVQLVDVCLAADDIAGAERAVETLITCAERHPSAYVRGGAALARGRVCLATGAGDPGACLREALAEFTRAETPMELAGCHLELAAALVTDQPEVAMAEARAALELFDRLQAARQVDAATALLRTLGVRTAGTRRDGELLTKREAEVLDLLGHGLSNPEIADRLYISRKTVEHHVGNVLAKLGLRSRGEAAAYTTRTK